MIRGEVWWADFGDPRGSAPALIHPAVIVSSDAFNLSRIPTVQVVLVSSVVKRAAMRGNVVIPSGMGGLTRTSVAMAVQVATIDRADLTGQLGALPPSIMAMIDNALRYAMAL